MFNDHKSKHMSYVSDPSANPILDPDLGISLEERKAAVSLSVAYHVANIYLTTKLVLIRPLLIRNAKYYGKSISG